MAGKPIATLTSMHVCPLCTGVVPHVGGPVIGPGTPNILINGKPAAIMGDMCTCVGPPDVIVMGNPSVLFNGVPVACMGDMTAHGGTITIGDPTVMISSSAPDAKAYMPLKDIPFPKLRAADTIGAALTNNIKNHNKGKENISKLKEEAKAFTDEKGLVESKDYTIKSNFALDQINNLAKQLSEANFIAITIKMFGTDIPFGAYKQLYKDASDCKIKPLEIEVTKGSINGHNAAYNNRRNIINISESVIKDSIENNDNKPELLATLTHEFGHHIDYLLRNSYSSVGGDAMNDEGAVFAFEVFDINLLENNTIDFADVTSPAYSGKLTIDLSKEHAELKQFVDQQAQLNEGKSPDNTFEFFNAGLLEKGYGHENIDKELYKVGFIQTDLPSVFLGNWLRDYSQLICGMTIRLSESAQVQLKKQSKNSKELARTLELHSGKLSREGLTQLVGILAAQEFVYNKQKGKWNEYNALECKKEFIKQFGEINTQLLGCYRPEEHIDNPKGLLDETFIDPDFFIGCSSEQLELNYKTGQKKYIKDIDEPRPSASIYIKGKLQSAAQKGKTKDGLRELGAALHVLEDYFAHSNFIEICLVKLVNDKVYTWVEEIEGKGYNVNTLSDKLLLDPTKKVVAKPYKSIQPTTNARASIIPVVTGVFGNVDTFATLCNKLRQLFKLPDFNYIPTEPGQRTFADLVIVAVLEDMAKGQSADASKNNGNYKGLDYAFYLNIYKNYVLAFRDFKAKKIKEGGIVGGSWKFIDWTSSNMATLIAYPQMLALNVLLYTLEGSVKELETYTREFGTNPTHTQLNKDDPGHPANDLAGELAVIAVKRVGRQMLKTWDFKENTNKLFAIIDEIMSHPCKTDWMDSTVLAWAAKNPKKVKKLEKSSYLQIAEMQQEKILNNFAENQTQKDLAFNKLITYYEQQNA